MSTEPTPQEPVVAPDPAPAEPNTPDSLLGNEVTLEEGEYFLAEGIKGTGEAPEWYKKDKYGTLADQAKAYTELEKQFGSFTGAPKDGYTLPEGIDAEDELAKAYIEFAKNSNMNQDGFEKGFELLSTQMGVNEEITRETEMAKLGDNAERRIQQLDAALKLKLGENYDSVKDLVTTADAIILAETLMKAYAPMKLPIEGGEHPQGLTWSDIEAEMFKKDEHGRLLRESNPAHNAKVERLIAEYAGTKEKVEVVG